MGDTQGRWQVCLRYGETMVLARHHHRPVSQILYRVIRTVMTKFHFFGHRAARQRKNLMAETDPK